MTAGVDSKMGEIARQLQRARHAAVGHPQVGWVQCNGRSCLYQFKEDR